jgi:hypothetical protein
MPTLQEYQAQKDGLQAQANAYAQQFRLTNPHNGSWDAFRHAYVSAEMSRVYGNLTAKILGDLNEAHGQVTGQPYQEKNMDLWNNQAGRRIGENSTGPGDSARRVRNAIENGSLITDPEHDGRQHSGTGQPAPNDKDPEVCCEECGAANTFPPPPPPPNPGQSVYIEDEEIVIPLMPMPPFNQAYTWSRSIGETTVPEEEPVAPAGPLQASVDTAMALIAETSMDTTDVAAFAVEPDHVFVPMVSTWNEHRDTEHAAV